MSHSSSRARELARQMLAMESGSASGPDREVAAVTAERVFGKLRAHLGGLVGVEGYQTILSRAMAMSREEVPWLATARVQPDGALSGITEATANLDAEEITNSCAVLLGNAMAVLIKLVGEPMAVILLVEVWPGLDGWLSEAQIETDAEVR